MEWAFVAGTYENVGCAQVRGIGAANLRTVITRPFKSSKKVAVDSQAPATLEPIERAILVLRGHRVLLDAELAALYGASTKALNQAVKRNTDRFPKDFMFRLSLAETDALNRSQPVTGSRKHRDPRFPPFAFTEHGAIMAAAILNSPRAVEMSVFVVRAFVRLRELLASNAGLVRKLDALERVARRRGIGFTADIR